MNTTSFVREVHFRSLLWRISKRWRKILIFALIIAVLGGCYKYYRNVSAGEETSGQEREYEKELKQYNAKVEAYQSASEEIDEGIEEKDEYLSNSTYMKIDPNHMEMASADIVITSEDEGQNPSNEEDLTNGLNRIVGAYCGFITDSIDYTALSKEMKTDPSYLWELVDVTADYYGNRLNVNVRHYDEKKALKILNYVLDAVMNKKPEYENNFGTFEIHIVNKTAETIVYSRLFSWLNDMLTSLTNLENQKNNVSAALEQLEGSKPQDTTEIGKYDNVPLFVLVGLIGGLILAILVEGIRLIFSNRVLSAEEFNHQFNLRRLMTIQESDGRKIRYDYHLDKIFGPENEEISEDERNRLLKKNIAQFGREGNYLITGQIDKSKGQELEDLIKKILGREDVRFTTGLSTNPEALTVLKDSQNIIVVAEVEKTSYRRAEEDIQTIINWDKNIVGSIVISQ